MVLYGNKLMQLRRRAALRSRAQKLIALTAATVMIMGIGTAVFAYQQNNQPAETAQTSAAPTTSEHQEQSHTTGEVAGVSSAAPVQASASNPTGTAANQTKPNQKTNTTGSQPAAQNTTQAASATAPNTVPATTSTPPKTTTPLTITGIKNLSVAPGSISEIYTLSTSDGSVVTWQPAWGVFIGPSGDEPEKSEAPYIVILSFDPGSYTGSSIEFEVFVMEDAMPSVEEFGIHVSNGSGLNVVHTVQLNITDL